MLNLLLSNAASILAGRVSAETGVLVAWGMVMTVREDCRCCDMFDRWWRVACVGWSMRAVGKKRWAGTGVRKRIIRCWKKDVKQMNSENGSGLSLFIIHGRHSHLVASCIC